MDDKAQTNNPPSEEQDIGQIFSRFVRQSTIRCEPAECNIEVAWRCAAAGLAVFPCNPKTKRPVIVEHWREESTTDFDQICKWWNVNAHLLVAIDLAKSNLLIIDGDRHGGPDGVVEVEKIFVEHGANLTVAPGIETPTSGRHYYFTQPDGDPLGNGDKAVRHLGINIRGVGGYVIAPGTMRTDGTYYKQMAGTPEFFEALCYSLIPPLPQFFIDLLRSQDKPRDKPQDDPLGEPQQSAQQSNNSRKATNREKKFAAATLRNLAHELSIMQPNSHGLNGGARLD